MWRCRGVCQASRANVLLFILSFLLWNEIPSLLACLIQGKGNIKMRRKGGRWQHMTWEDEWRTEHLISQGQSVFLSRLSEIPHSTGQKQKGLSVSCLAETADWFQPSNPNIESSFKKERARQDSRLKLVREQEEELKEFKDNLCETMWGGGGVWSALIAHDRVSWWCFLCGCEASVPTAMNLSTVRSGVYAHRVSTATGRRAQCCHGDTNSGRGKHSHVFDIKVVSVEVKVTPSSPPPLTGTVTGSVLNPGAFVPSERPHSQGFTWAEFTWWDHWNRTYKQSRRYKNAITSACWNNTNRPHTCCHQSTVCNPMHAYCGLTHTYSYN